MKLMQHGGAAARKSTPLSEQDLADLAAIRSAPEFAGSTESTVLNYLVRLGMNAVKERQMDQGYAELAEQRRGDRAQRQQTARRRRPSWADEQ